MLDALRRPIWNALTTGWRAHAEGDARALRLRRDMGMFGAAADRSPESLAALAALVPDKGELWTVEGEQHEVPGCRPTREAVCVQMIAEGVDAPAPSHPIVELADADAVEMHALATLTEPGPYVERSDRLGRFVGVRHDGRLVAMAGERMRMAGLAEISAVCTHPDWRGRGLASVLMREVARRMLARGERPFLHTYAHNSGAIALYERLGFVRCGEVGVRAWSR